MAVIIVVMVIVMAVIIVVMVIVMAVIIVIAVVTMVVMASMVMNMNLSIEMFSLSPNE